MKPLIFRDVNGRASPDIISLDDLPKAIDYVGIGAMDVHAIGQDALVGKGMNVELVTEQVSAGQGRL